MSETIWLEGAISVSAGLIGGSRVIECVYIQRGKWSRDIQALKALAQDAGVKIQRVEKDFVDAHAKGQSHGGVIAQAGPRQYKGLDEIIPRYESRPFLAMLDGIEDPFNFGQAVRSLYAAGVDGLIVPPRNWLSAADVVARSSAGAIEMLPIAQVDSADTAAAFLRRKGMVVACTTRESDITIYEADLTQPLFLLIGGEKRGITRSFLEKSDLKLTIPYGREYGRSLGTAASAAVISFELMRQRRALADKQA